MQDIFFFEISNYFSNLDFLKYVSTVSKNKSIQHKRNCLIRRYSHRLFLHHFAFHATKFSVFFTYSTYINNPSSLLDVIKELSHSFMRCKSFSTKYESYDDELYISYPQVVSKVMYFTPFPYHRTSRPLKYKNVKICAVYRVPFVIREQILARPNVKANIY